MIRSTHSLRQIAAGMLLAWLAVSSAHAQSCGSGDIADEPTNFDQLWTHVSGTLDIGTRILFAKTEQVMVDGRCDYVFMLKFMDPTGLIYWRSYQADTLRTVDVDPNTLEQTDRDDRPSAAAGTSSANEASQ